MVTSVPRAAKKRVTPKERASRKEQTAQLRNLGITDPALIGDRLGVHARTVQRYLRELEGDVDRRVILYPEIKPQVLEHLRRYPHLRLPAYQLARVLQVSERSGKTVKRALRSLEREGLVRHEIGTRKEGDYSRAVRVILWSLAEQGQPDGQ
ncbi:hypothetical protein [Nonomuraea cavernae]|uniref:Uncharacterized protein n=1 Tax=Nonomuraea cavernae TaxID=2045107 RepID=A0A917YRM3_9ACTN|nr:hypothetical protein [Nonomuraea cavernae]MCA2184713.1 hypothetical protein [Nonomuraea cavernae]GGO62981.1 hypothetical protein GCM10012289_08830 [Nonomuraea cavernae]